MLILGIDPGLTPTLLAYIAGLFDGEGYIGVKKRLPNGRNKWASPKYSVAVSIGMTDREPIELVARSFNAVNRVRVRQRKAHYKTMYELDFENDRAVALLRAIRPYLGSPKSTSRAATCFTSRHYEFQLRGRGKGGTLLILGIDPGLQGAVAIMDAQGHAERVFDLPIQRDRSLAWVNGYELAMSLREVIDDRPATVIIERVSAMPKQGVASSFKFGVGFGSILGVLQSLQIPIELVTPAKWKREVGLDSADKKASLHKARLLFPHMDLRLEKHEGRAEALLLCFWYLNRHRTHRLGVAA